MEHPPDLDRVGCLGPVVVPQEADPADEAARLGILGGPEAEALVPPSESELEDVRAGVEDAVVLLELRLRVDLGECLGVSFTPLPQEKARRPQLPGDQPLASFQSSPMPTSTASGGGGGGGAPGPPRAGAGGWRPSPP